MQQANDCNTPIHNTVDDLCVRVHRLTSLNASLMKLKSASTTPSGKISGRCVGITNNGAVLLLLLLSTSTLVSTSMRDRNTLNKKIGFDPQNGFDPRSFGSFVFDVASGVLIDMRRHFDQPCALDLANSTQKRLGSENEFLHTEQHPSNGLNAFCQPPLLLAYVENDPTWQLILECA